MLEGVIKMRHNNPKFVIGISAVALGIAIALILALLINEKSFFLVNKYAYFVLFAYFAALVGYVLAKSLRDRK